MDIHVFIEFGFVRKPFLPPRGRGAAERGGGGPVHSVRFPHLNSLRITHLNGIPIPHTNRVPIPHPNRLFRQASGGGGPVYSVGIPHPHWLRITCSVCRDRPHAR